MISTDVGVWIASMYTIFIYTYFISERQNVLYRFAQSTVVGLALGYIVAIVMGKTIDALVFTRVGRGEWIMIIPFLIGLLIYGRLVPGYTHLARTPIALIVSVGLGLGARATLDANVFKQILGASGYLLVGVSPFWALSNLFYLTGLVCAIFYFYFTMGPGMVKATRPLATYGRYVLMLYFGQRFGATIFFRLTLFIGRLQFLLFQWLGFKVG